MKRPLCYAPWITTYDYSYGVISPCCEFKSKKVHKRVNGLHSPTKGMSMEERFRHPSMEEFKNRLLTKDNLDEIPECINCSHNNKTGVGSLSSEFDDMVAKYESHPQHNYKWNVDKFNMIYMDYRESNVCNFTCRMCGPSLSSTHLQMQRSFNEDDWLFQFADKKGIIKNIHGVEKYLDAIDDLKIINFAGGEPMLTDSMFIIIKDLIKRKMFETDISIVTNGSLLHRHENDLLELLSKFKNVQISVSIDCIGEQHNYWRSAKSWHLVEKNLDRMIEWGKQLDSEDSRRDVRIRTAIGFQNSFAAKDVFDRYEDIIPITFNQIHDKGMNLQCIPQEYLDKLVEHWKDYPRVQNVFRNITPLDSKQAIEDIKCSKIGIQDKYDKHFKTKVEDVFPEWAEYYKLIN